MTPGNAVGRTPDGPGVSRQSPLSTPTSEPPAGGRGVRAWRRAWARVARRARTHPGAERGRAAQCAPTRSPTWVCGGGMGRRQRRHAHPVAHRGPERVELVAVLLVLVLAAVAGVGGVGRVDALVTAHPSGRPERGWRA